MVHTRDRETSIREWLKALAPILASLAAVLALFNISDYLDWVTKSKIQHLESDTTWRATATTSGGWNLINYDDSGWQRAASPAPHRSAIDLPSFSMRTMWVSEDSDTCYLRNTFHVGEVSDVKKATLTCIADDDQRVYLNEMMIISDENASSGPLVIMDILPLLREGDNLVAVKAWSPTQPYRHFAMDIALELRQ